jgi:FAD/FMN-containing dehydrogenase
VAEEIARVTEVLTAAGARDLRVSQSEAERLRFWAGRKAAFPAVGRITPDYYCMDGTIPRKRLAEMLSAISEMEKKYGLRCANVFHAGDGNLHPLIMYDAKPGELGAGRSLRRRNPGTVGGARRLDHRRARRRYRERSTRCACSTKRRNWKLFTASRQPSTIAACSIPARRCPACIAAPNTAACMCITATPNFPNWSAF